MTSLPRPRKRFGQNFLQDSSIIRAIIQAINPQSNEHLVEIGPGQGALTIPLLEKLERGEKGHPLTAIEIDRDLIAYLKPLEQKGLHLIEGDALDMDYSTLANEKIRLVGNLPYNISTPLLIHLLQFTHCIQDAHFMLQKEVGERLAANPCTKHYGRLSVMIQYFFTVDLLFLVPPEAFYPKPAVDSCIVRLTPRLITPDEHIELKMLESIVKQAFAHRRKTLRNNLKLLLSEDDWAKLMINPQRRPEELTINEFVRIAQFML